MNLVLAILWHSFDTTVQEDFSAFAVSCICRDDMVLSNPRSG